MTLLRRRWPLVVALHVVAVSVGVGVAIAAPKLGEPEGVYAANHCTRYAPGYSTDSGCSNTGPINPGSYMTGATGLRDSNLISISASRWIYVWYSGGSVSSSYGTYLSQGASGGYAYANCRMDGSAGPSGRCTTYWHD